MPNEREGANGAPYLPLLMFFLLSCCPYLLPFRLSSFPTCLAHIAYLCCVLREGEGGMGQTLKVFPLTSQASKHLKTQVEVGGGRGKSPTFQPLLPSLVFFATIVEKPFGHMGGGVSVGWLPHTPQSVQSVLLPPPPPMR